MRQREFPAKVAIVGAGTMATGIAIRYALAGADVALVSRRQRTLDAASDRVASGLEQLVANDAAEASEAEAAIARVSYGLDLEAGAAGAHLVLESIAEDADVKRDVLARAEAVAAPDAVLTSNTSSLSLGDISSDLARPERFAGYHWFNPAELVELVEVVCAPSTDEPTTEDLLRWSRAVGTRPVLVRREVPGFIANRLQYALLREAHALVEAGVCSYADVDAVMTTGLGARWAAVGPIESMDLAGLDIHLAVAGQLYPALSTTTEPPARVAELVERGDLGCKTGAGLLGDYDADEIAGMVRRRADVTLALARRRAVSRR
jgi:3-hydroxybutyryl-CoA dehydrogenase